MDQVVDLSMTLYSARLFPARQCMLTERVHRSATRACVSLTIALARRRPDGHANGVVFQMETACIDEKSVEPVATMSCRSCQ